MVEPQAILLTGENGSGKSTLLKLLAGLLKPNSGSLHYAGMPIAKALDEQKVFYHAQDAAENCLGYDTLSDLWIWRQILKKDFDVEDLLSRWSFSGLQHKPMFRLSDGEKRISSLLILAQLYDRFWLLDEPFSALDKSRNDILRAIIDEKLKVNRSMIMISHGWEASVTGFDYHWHLDKSGLEICKL